MSEYSRRRFVQDSALTAAVLSRSRGWAALPVSSVPEAPCRLVFDEAAVLWPDALPVGNGRLGAMVFGDTRRERIQLNEETLWMGEKRDRNNPGAGRVPEIRELLFAGKIKEAEAMAVANLISVPQRLPCYQTLGDLWLDFEDDSEVSEYRMELDLTRAVLTVRYRAGGVAYRRQIFCSAPDQALVIRLEADQTGRQSFKVRLDRPVHFSTVAVGSDRLVMTGEAMPAKPTTDPITQERQVGVRFRAELLAEVQGGSVKPEGESLRVAGANSVTLRIVAATSYRTDDMEGRCKAYFSGAKKPTAALLRRHVNDYRSYFLRCDLQLMAGDDSLCETATDERWRNVRAGKEDVGLQQVFFHYGRYLLISSSRPGTLAANLQGIWNESVDPPWGSKYTVNINTEMNYWMAERVGFGDLHEPMFDLLDRTRSAGALTAQKYYKSRGFVVHHNTDLWGDASPVDILTSGIWPMGAAWLSLHLWDHYEYGLNTEFLRNRAYPRLKQIAEFLLDYLVEAPDGTLVTGPSLSPENRYVLPDGTTHSLCMGPVMDIEITRAVFDRVIRSSRVLNLDEDLREQVEKAQKRLPDYKIGRTGALQEWQVDYEQHEPGHRHISHLFALFPDDQITLRGTPDLARAARLAMEQRLAAGGGSTGWSRTWLIGCWARLEDGEEAYRSLQTLLSRSTRQNLLDVCGTNERAPYQIDGNLGAVAVMSEMLLASHGGVIRFLPALPKAWPSGFYKGLRARGGLEVDVTWHNGAPTIAVLRAHADRLHTLCAPEGHKIEAVEHLGRKIKNASRTEHAFEFEARRGASYSVTFRAVG